MNISQLWNELEQDINPNSNGYLTRRVRPESICNLRIAVTEPEGHRMLLFKVRRITAALIQKYPDSEGFRVQKIILPDDDPEYVTLHLVLTHNRFADIFTVLIEDIINGVAAKLTEVDGLEEFVARLRRWQFFLKTHTLDGLGEHQQQGLYGELWFLRRSVLPYFEKVVGIQAWTGPQGTQQDFQFERCAVEIKTTASKQHQKLTISSERQLDDTGTGVLILLHLSLDVRQGRGETLPDMVASVRSLLSGNPAAVETFEALLFEAGYLDIHAPRYEQNGYTMRETNYFKVEGDFPRIVEADLRNGVGDVRYTIGVAECKRFSVVEPEVLSLIRRQHE